MPNTKPDLQDEVMPDAAWDFNAEVTAVFDNMLARSIPQYDVMRQACFDIGAQFVQDDTWIVDLGCSRGEALAAFVTHFKGRNHYLGVEIAESMFLAARGRFTGDTNVVIRQADLRNYYPPEAASLTLAVLTLQFTPIEYRQRIVRQIYQSLLPGGAFVIVEKVLGATADLDELMVDLYYGLKDINGYTPEQIERKRLSLEGVLVPVTAKWNEELLRMAGFRQVDCFWRWMNFAGWVATK
jgi:tRNA (cmo5U34)-methyltransferase